MKKNSCSKGFTLTELLVASIIIVFTAAGTFVLLGGALQLSGRRSHSYEAFEYAAQTLDTLKDYVTENDSDAMYRLTGDTPSCGGASTRYALRDLPGASTHCHPLPAGVLGDQLQGRRRYEVQDVDLNGDTVIDYKRVIITVEWTEKL